jgi:hypothetical protein
VIKNLLVVASLFFSFNLRAAEQISCGPTIQGGGDIFPWSQAQPFPWTKIQGLWIIEGKSDMILRFKVIRQTSRLKQLEVEVFSNAQDCPLLQTTGIGIINASEKNVVRINLGNKFVRLAVFLSDDLKINKEICGSQVMAISMIDLSADTASRVGAAVAEIESQNMVLKKITSSMDLYCKKRN